jgi:hypothetical protein
LPAGQPAVIMPAFDQTIQEVHMTKKTATWLKAWSIASAGLGLLIALSAFPMFAWPTNLFLDLAFWPIDGSPQLASPDARLFAVIAGGLTAGWCLLLGMLFDRAYRTADNGLVRLAVISMVGWFVIDSIGSIAVGAWMNAIMNAAILAGFLVPLLAGSQAFSNGVAAADRAR